MLTKNQIGILNLFRKNIFLELNIIEIAKKLKKSYPKIHRAVKELNKEGFIKIKKIGKASLCFVELNQKTIFHLSYLDDSEMIQRSIPNREKILEFKEFIEDIILLTGSYAKNKQTPESDMDLVIITKERAFYKQKLIEKLTSLLKPSIHPNVITYKDFIKMLLDREENYGKEIFRNRIILRNSHRYYGLIKEAIENGFRG